MSILKTLLTFLTLSTCKKNPFTYNSVLKLESLSQPVFLSTVDLHFNGVGSGKQIVIASGADGKAHWQVSSPKKGEKRQGAPIKCGAVVVLRNNHFDCYLHSSGYSSIISRQREVSCHFGREDQNNLWVVDCKGSHWQVGEKMRLKHKRGRLPLSSSRRFLFNRNHCDGCVVLGNQEVFVGLNGDSDWKVDEGVFFDSSEKNLKKDVKYDL